MPFGLVKLGLRGYPTVKKIDDMFIRFDTMHECDRQTDTSHTQTHRQKPHDGIGRAYA